MFIMMILVYVFIIIDSKIILLAIIQFGKGILVEHHSFSCEFNQLVNHFGRNFCYKDTE